MAYTLLDIVQLTLSSLDSDQVNDIGDTTESLQIVDIARTVYNDLVTRLDLPNHHTLFNLTASTDNTQPVKMTLPRAIVRLDWVKYDEKESTDTYSNYQEVKFKPLDEFIQLQNDSLKDLTSDVGEMSLTLAGDHGNTSTVSFMYRTDRHPTWYTSFDNETLVFDAYDSTEDTTLQKSKTMCSGWCRPIFNSTNTFTPDFDEQQHNLFLHEVKAQAWLELKQQQNPRAELDARRTKIRTQRDKRRIPLTDRGELDQLPNYGRRR